MEFSNSTLMIFPLAIEKWTSLRFHKFLVFLASRGQVNMCFCLPAQCYGLLFIWTTMATSWKLLLTTVVSNSFRRKALPHQHQDHLVLGLSSQSSFNHCIIEDALKEQRNSRMSWGRRENIKNVVRKNKKKNLKCEKRISTHFYFLLLRFYLYFTQYCLL